MSIRPCVCAKHTQGHFASYPNIKFYSIYIHIYWQSKLLLLTKKIPFILFAAVLLQIIPNGLH